MYASPYNQDVSTGAIHLCVSVMKGLTVERFFHIQARGELILEDTEVISNLTDIRILHQCDSSCRTDGQPGQIKKMFLVGESLARQITSSPHYAKAIA